MKQAAVFTDLDGTFLDHHTYEYEQALPAVKWLKANRVPLFSVSSKTLAEQLDLFEGQGLFDGYVAENGGVIHYKGQTEILGPNGGQVEQARLTMENFLGYSLPGFRSRNLDLVVQATGLTRYQASLACDRLCSDPLLARVDEKLIPQLNELIDPFCTVLVHGGRFLTLCGRTDKALAMQQLLKMHFGETAQPYVLALGDSANDLSMLHAASEGVLMANPSGKGVDAVQAKGLICLHKGGPQAWADVVKERMGGYLQA